MTTVLEKVEDCSFERGPNEPCLATWWRQATEGTAYARCALPARHMQGQVLRLKHTDLAEEGDKVVMPRQRGASIWQFPGDATRGMLMANLKFEHGIPVFIEVDDNYLVPSPKIPGALEKSPWNKRIADGDSAGYSNEAHRRLVPWVDGIIVATELLAKQYRKLNPNVFVCPNQIEPADWPELEKPDDGVLRVGWAGSASHRWDAHLGRQALEWAAKQDGVEVVMVGFIPPGYRFELTQTPWADDLADYRRNLMSLDVGIAPILENPWAACKSDIKALEYAMAGVMPIVSRTEPYRPWWEREMPCLVARTPREFLKQVQWAVAHRDEVKQIAAEARAHVLAERTIEKNVWRWQEAIASKED